MRPLSRLQKLTRWTAPLALAGLVAGSGCTKQKVMVLVADNHPTINLFGFEESELHHINNTVELHRNVFLVAYDPKKPNTMEWINCPVPAEYKYHAAPGRRVETIHISNEAELQAKVPVNYARFQGYLKAGNAVDFHYVTIGAYELMGAFKIPKGDPDCAKATHYVSTLSVGAFVFAEQVSVEGGIAGQETTTGVGAGLDASRKKASGTSTGDLDSCLDENQAFFDCFTPLQLMMTPIPERNWVDGHETQVVRVEESDGSGYTGPSREQVQQQQQQREAAGVASVDLSLGVDAEVWRPGSFMAHALEQVLLVAQRVNESSNYGFDDKASTVVAGYLRNGQSHSLNRPLEAGAKYAVFATGATDTANLDIIITGPSGQEVAVDQADDNNPAVSFQAPEDGGYQIRLVLTGGSDEFGAMVIMREGGLRIDTDILQGAFQSLLDNATAASSKVIEMGFGSGLVFHENDWALSGTVLYPGETIRQRGLQLDPQSAVFTGVAHDPNMNIDLEIIDANSGASEADTAPDANPLVLIDKPDPNSSYDMRLMYPDSGNGEPALATALILKLGE
ncbi:hypothetical protein PPSIR1_24849 [Plesiocystis pacifica SIR-1]|uniref:Lipoprotein n=1 Tax=Plesiocystis pacifica SIR-1 TaxID=391625 RepID=A6G9G4_9BACT|nr:PPC domain-containing protein [Plesiocystis pacifica]EDM77472.1 hypothetical protein PPSIR1_24849 [Plesiocystis pacifica SIR-1]